MSSDRYIESDETLYYLDRLDRYTPLTAKFISMGANVMTPLTEDELIPIILGETDNDDESKSRHLHKVGCDCGGRTYKEIEVTDNNHSLHWNQGYVHAVGRPITFWNLDGDLNDVLDEAFAIDDKIGSTLIRPYVFDIIEDDTTFLEFLSQNTDLDFAHWLDERRVELPPAPDMDNYDEAVADTYYDALDEMIFTPLSETSEYNDDIQSLITRVASQDNDTAEKLKRRLCLNITSKVFPLNDKAEGYIKDGYKTMVPNDARRGAVYVGNIVDVLNKHDRGLELIEDDKIRSATALGTGAKDTQYPDKMRNGMPSDWLTEGPYEELQFEPKQRYPQLGSLDILMMDHEFEVESNAVFDEPNYDAFDHLISKMRKKMGYDQDDDLTHDND